MSSDPNSPLSLAHSYIANARFHRRFTLEATATHGPLNVTYAEFGRQPDESAPRWRCRPPRGSGRRSRPGSRGRRRDPRVALPPLSRRQVHAVLLEQAGQLDESSTVQPPST